MTTAKVREQHQQLPRPKRVLVPPSAGLLFGVAPRADRCSLLACSAGSYKAVQWTLKNLYREGDVLHLLHVVPSVNSVRPAPFSLAAVLPPEEGLQEQMAAHMRDLIETHYMRLAIEYGAQCEVDLVHGKCNQSVSTAIVGKCEELAASVVVLSMQKQGWLDSLFQVDVSKQVAETCSRPTLIYHCEDATCAPML